MKSRLFPDVVIGEPTNLELLSSENEALINRTSSLLVLDFGLYVVDGLGRLHIKGDGLAPLGLHEDLHSYLMGQLDTLRSRGGTPVRSRNLLRL